MITKEFPIEMGCEVTTWNRKTKKGGAGIVVGILDNGAKLRLVRPSRKSMV